MKRCRVLHVITSLMVGGAEVLLLEIAEKLRRHGFDSDVVVLGKEGLLEPRFRELGVTVHRLNMQHRSMPSVRDAIELARLGRRIDPDLIHGWMAHGNLAGSLIRAVLRKRTPLIWSIHQSLGEYHTLPLNTRFAIRANRFLSGSADAIAFVAKASLTEHRTFGFRDRKAVYIPNGVDSDRFRAGAEQRAAARALLGLPETTTVVGHVARYHPSKDQHTLLAALKLAFADRRDCCAVLIGRDLTADNPELHEWLSDERFSGQIRMLGPRSDVASLLPGFDLFCLSSAFNEACPVAVLEAMSCGVRCVVTNVGDSAWIVGDTGAVAPVRNAEALAREMARLIDMPGDQALDASCRARERVIAHFSLDGMVEAYRNIYLDVIERRPVDRRHRN